MIGKVLGIGYWLGLVILVTLAGAAITSKTPAPGGWRLLAVQSGSMAPAVPVGSVVMVKPANQYVAGDVVSYRAGKEIITHRIISKTVNQSDSEPIYKTKGDANKKADTGMVASGDILGKVVLDLPYVGYAVGFSQTKAGLIALIIVPGTIVIYSEALSIKNEIVDVWADRKEDRPKQPENV